jgi:SRSO17 transposase
MALISAKSPFLGWALSKMASESDIKRKSLPEIAKAVGLHDSQPLQNFLTDSPWSVVCLRDRRLELTLKMLNGRSFKLVIDETCFVN